MPKRLDTRDPSFEDEFTAFLGQKRETTADVNSAVETILLDVRQRGNDAVCETTARFDRFQITPDTMVFSPKEISAARANVQQIRSMPWILPRSVFGVFMKNSFLKILTRLIPQDFGSDTAGPPSIL